MLIIPEIQIQDGKVVTRSTTKGSDTIHNISPAEAAQKFANGGARMLQVVDIDAARSEPTNNEANSGIRRNTHIESYQRLV